MLVVYIFYDVYYILARIKENEGEVRERKKETKKKIKLLTSFQKEETEISKVESIGQKENETEV